MAHMKALAGSVIAFACAPGTIAKDQSTNGRNGLFTYHLLQHITKPAENILLILTDVTNGVADETNDTQIPCVTSALRKKDVYLVSLSLNRIDRPLIKSGTKFGGDGGHSFDDFITNDLTHSHYLRGMITECKQKPLDWCQFCYSLTNDDSESLIETELQGTCETNNVIERFLIDKNERINKVQVVVENVILFVNNVRKLVPLIRGIRFFTTNRRTSKSIDHLQGDLHTEEFHGYFVGYVTGRSGLLIDQLQFHWYNE